MSHLQVFYGHFTTRTIVDHRTWISEKPLKNHRCQWSICKKTFNGDGPGMVKPLKNHRWQWYPGKKTLPSHHYEKITIVEVYWHTPPSPCAKVFTFRFFSARLRWAQTASTIAVCLSFIVAPYVAFPRSNVDQPGLSKDCLHVQCWAASSE